MRLPRRPAAACLLVLGAALASAAPAGAETAVAGADRYVLLEVDYDASQQAFAPGKSATVDAQQAWRIDRLTRLAASLPEVKQLAENQLQQLAAGSFTVLSDLSPPIKLLVLPVIADTATLSHSVGMLLQDLTVDLYEPICTVFLARPSLVLTAQHCVGERSAPHHYKVYFPFEGIRDVADDAIHEFCDDFSGDDCLDNIDDLAKIELQSPYVLLNSERIASGPADSAPEGLPATIVGFGPGRCDPSCESPGYQGVKHEATIRVRRCTPCDISTPGGDPSKGGRFVCFFYDLGDPSQPQPGILQYDSGGPMLARSWTSQFFLGSGVTGVASEFQVDCQCYSWRAFYVNTRHQRYQDWLDEARCVTDCSRPSGDRIFTLLEEPLRGIGNASQLDYAIQVDRFAKTLIITLNYEVGPPGTRNRRLELELAGLNPSCEQHLGVEVCIATRPLTGNYTITVKRLDDDDPAPAFQLAAVSVNCPHIVCWLSYLQQATAASSVERVRIPYRVADRRNLPMWEARPDD